MDVLILVIVSFAFPIVGAVFVISLLKGAGLLFGKERVARGIVSCVRIGAGFSTHMLSALDAFAIGVSFILALYVITETTNNGATEGNLSLINICVFLMMTQLIRIGYSLNHSKNYAAFIITLVALAFTFLSALSLWLAIAFFVAFAAIAGFMGLVFLGLWTMAGYLDKHHYVNPETPSA